MPSVIKRRGQPKGHLLTAVGLPSKKGKSTTAKKPCSFLKLHSSEKERGTAVIIHKYYVVTYLYNCTHVVMLQWFVLPVIAEKCLSGGEIITEEFVECRPEKVPNSCLDENVDIFLIKKHFTFDAWQVILQIVESKKENKDWFCTICSHDLQERTSILCDCCLCWFHLSCVGLKNVLKRKEWFCRFCFGRIESENKFVGSGIIKITLLWLRTGCAVTKEMIQKPCLFETRKRKSDDLLGSKKLSNKGNMQKESTG